jgi:phosphoribosylformylglycinamidine cyclo-ligase
VGSDPSSETTSPAYAAAGVDLTASDRAVAAIVGALGGIETGRPSRVVPLPGHYASVLRVSETLGVAFATDGVGSKLVVADRPGGSTRSGSTASR